MDRKGTDHGSGSCLFVVGPGVKPGPHGKHPSLTDLADGDLKYHTDFRRVYATLLENWLRVDSKMVLGEKFADGIHQEGVTTTESPRMDSHGLNHLFSSVGIHPWVLTGRYAQISNVEHALIVGDPFLTEQLAGPAKAVHDREYDRHFAAGLPDRLAAFNAKLPFVETSSTIATPIPAFKFPSISFCVPCSFILSRHPEAFHRPAMQMVADDGGGRERNGAYCHSSNGIYLQVLSALK